MSYIYAMSDIHGCLLPFEEALSYVDLSGDNRLVLLGDYIHGGPDSDGVLKKIMELEQQHGCAKVIVLSGNHEDMAVDGRWPISEDRLAGVDEEAGDMWEWGTDDYTFTEKYPADTGSFYRDIIAGHIGTAAISGNRNFHDIYYDGESHYYVDGTVLDSGIIPVIKVDTETNKYYRVTKSGGWLILPYDQEN